MNFLTDYKFDYKQTKPTNSRHLQPPFLGAFVYPILKRIRQARKVKRDLHNQYVIVNGDGVIEHFVVKTHLIFLLKACPCHVKNESTS